jgi:hypothetical protein
MATLYLYESTYVKFFCSDHSTKQKKDNSGGVVIVLSIFVRLCFLREIFVVVPSQTGWLYQESSPNACNTRLVVREMARPSDVLKSIISSAEANTFS